MRKIGSKILVVDDEPEIRRFLSISLKGHDYIPLEAEAGWQAIREVTTAKPDLVVLDVGLPDISGIEVIRSLREWSKIPVIMLSVRKEEEEKVEAFEAGANDYVTKPFGMAEMLARIRAQLRDRILEEQEETVFTTGDLQVDLLAHSVTLRGERIRLTPKEYQLLSILIRNAGRVVTHRQLIRDLWGDAYGNDTQYLRIYIRQLRQKIEQDRLRDQYIHNEPSIGYRLEHIDG